MRALIDHHSFRYTVSVPWPVTDSPQIDWDYGIYEIENWLTNSIGNRLVAWAWSDSGNNYQVGVGFRWDQDRMLFVMKWG